MTLADQYLRRAAGAVSAAHDMETSIMMALWTRQDLTVAQVEHLERHAAQVAADRWLDAELEWDWHIRAMLGLDVG